MSNKGETDQTVLPCKQVFLSVYICDYELNLNK